MDKAGPVSGFNTTQLAPQDLNLGYRRPEHKARPSKQALRARVTRSTSHRRHAARDKSYRLKQPPSPTARRTKPRG